MYKQSIKQTMRLDISEATDISNMTVGGKELEYVEELSTVKGRRLVLALIKKFHLTPKSNRLLTNIYKKG